jgi:hypothetical protein
MILKFDKFLGKVKDSLDKEEVIELVSLITDLKPSLPEEIDNSNLSKLIDNINYYKSEDGKYNISVYFRESDVYRNQDGTVTYGNFKSLFKVTISKLEGEFKIGDIKDYTLLTSSIIKDIYSESKVVIKIDDERVSFDDFELLEDNKTIENFKLIIRII